MTIECSATRSNGNRARRAAARLRTDVAEADALPHCVVHVLQRADARALLLGLEPLLHAGRLHRRGVATDLSVVAVERHRASDPDTAHRPAAGSRDVSSLATLPVRPPQHGSFDASPLR